MVLYLDNPVLMKTLQDKLKLKTLPGVPQPQFPLLLNEAVMLMSNIDDFLPIQTAQHYDLAILESVVNSSVTGGFKGLWEIKVGYEAIIVAMRKEASTGIYSFAINKGQTPSGALNGIQQLSESSTAGEVLSSVPIYLGKAAEVPTTIGVDTTSNAADTAISVTMTVLTRIPK